MSNFMAVGICWIGLTRADLGCWRLTLKAAYQAIFVFCMPESLNSNFACGNRCTHVILLPIAPQPSLLIITK